MRAVDIMSTPVHTVTSTASVHAAAEILLRHRVASLPVVDDGRLVGMLSEIDVARARAPHDPRSRMRMSPEPADLTDPATVVGTLMTREVVSASPGDDTADLASLLSRGGVRAVSVVDDGPVVGIVSRRESIRRWEDYSRAKDEMFVHTDTAEAPWWVVEGDDKRAARINMMSHLLSTVPYFDVERPPVELPPRPAAAAGYERPPRELFRAVPDVGVRTRAGAPR